MNYIQDFTGRYVQTKLVKIEGGFFTQKEENIESGLEILIT